MKIILCEPKSSGYNVYSLFKIPRLGLAILGAILRKAGHDICIYAENLANLDFNELFKADAVGISTLTCTAPRAYAIADIIRENSKAVIFMGGPHVSFIPEEALQHCDFVFRGEADKTIVPFFKALEAKTGFDKIPGLSYHCDGKIIHNPPASFVSDLDSIPSPDLSLYVGEIPKDVTPIITSRGCPYNCTFCTVNKMFGRGYRTNSIERVISELKALLNKGCDWFFFYDDNFAANPKRTKALLKRIISEKLKFKWGAQIRAEIAKDSEMMDLMKQAGADFFYIGFESINPETLECFQKKQSLEDIESSIKTIHKYDINIHGMFVLGSDADTKEVISKTTDFAIKTDLETIQLMALIPLPGTAIYKEIKDDNRILTFDWSKYDGHYAVFKPLRMSPFDLQWGIIKGLMKFYSWKEVLKRINYFDWRNTFLKIYGHYILKNWSRLNKEWIKAIKEISSGLSEKSKLLQNTITEAAQDIYRKVEKLKKKGLINPSL